MDFEGLDFDTCRAQRQNFIRRIRRTDFPLEFLPMSFIFSLAPDLEARLFDSQVVWCSPLTRLLSLPDRSWASLSRRRAWGRGRWEMTVRAHLLQVVECVAIRLWNLPVVVAQLELPQYPFRVQLVVIATTRLLAHYQGFNHSPLSQHYP